MKDFKIEDIPAFGSAVELWLRRVSFDPDVIVAIERAGVLLGHEVAQCVSRPWLTVRFARRGGSIKARLGPLLRRLPNRTLHWLRELEQQSGVHRILPRAAAVMGRLEAIPPNARVLVVDDAIDSGATMEAVCRRIIEIRPRAEIKSAVVTVTGDPDGTRGVFVLNRGLCRFPWSADSLEFGEFERLLGEAMERGA